MQDGYFDESGNYIRKKNIKTQDEIDNPDEFLDNIDKMDIYTPKNNNDDSDEESKTDISPYDSIKLLNTVYQLLDDEETVSDSMKRLTGKNKNTLPSLQQNNKPNIPQFNLLTESADRLIMEGGFKDIYEMTREDIKQEYNVFFK